MLIVCLHFQFIKMVRRREVILLTVAYTCINMPIHAYTCWLICFHFQVIYQRWNGIVEYSCSSLNMLIRAYSMLTFPVCRSGTAPWSSHLLPEQSLRWQKTDGNKKNNLLQWHPDWIGQTYEMLRFNEVKTAKSQCTCITILPYHF